MLSGLRFLKTLNGRETSKNYKQAILTFIATIKKVNKWKNNTKLFKKNRRIEKNF